QPLQGHSNWVRSVAYSPDGRYVVSGSNDNTIRIWDASTGQQVGQPLQGHSDSVNSVAYSLNGTYVASGSNDQTLRLWDASTTQQTSKSQLFPVLASKNRHTIPQSTCSTIPSTQYISSSELAFIVSNVYPSNGWVLSNGKHILWLPSHMRNQFPASQLCVISQNPLQHAYVLDWSLFCHGDKWTSVFSG
ncbi:WD40 repeat-like protein, partial [Pluteus cervinus]